MSTPISRAKMNIKLIHIAKYSLYTLCWYCWHWLSTATCCLLLLLLLKFLAYRFQNLSSLCPDISDEQCATVAPQKVLENVGQFGLSVGDVILSLVGQHSNHLLQEGERLV